MGVVASISDRVGDLGSYLREQREHARLSLRQLATLAGVSNPYLSQVERGLRRPSAEVLQQIANGLRISAEALYVRAGILDEHPRPDVEAAVHADPLLSDRQKRVILDIYASFRAENARAEQAKADGEQAAAGNAGPAGLESAPVQQPTRKRSAAKRAAVKGAAVKRAAAKKAAATRTSARLRSTGKRVAPPASAPQIDDTSIDSAPDAR